MASILTMNLTSFIKDVYEVDLEEILDGSNFYFENQTFSITPQELTLAQELYPEFSEADREELIQSTKNRLYEVNYIGEYYDRYECALEDKINQDITNLITLLKDDLEDHKVFGTEKDLSVVVDWTRDLIIFKGKLSLLDTSIMEVINSYGMFGYDSLEQFKEFEGRKIGCRIKNLIHWLKETENIYGSIYDLFRFSSRNIGDYIFPDTVINLEELQEQYNCDYSCHKAV